MRRPFRFGIVIACALVGVAARAHAQSAKEHERQGRTYLAANRWDDALAEFKAAIDAEPDRIAIYFEIARAYEGKGDLQAALDAYTHYPESGPNADEAKGEIARLTAAIKAKNDQLALVHANQGKAFADNGAYDQAVAEYLAAYQLSPQPIYYYDAAHAYEGKGDKQNALAEYKQYVAADPSGAEVADAQQAIAKLERDLGNAATAGADKAKAEVAAGQAKTAADAAARAAQAAVDAAKLGNVAERSYQVAAAHAAADQAEVAASAAEGAAVAADEAARSAQSPDAIASAVAAKQLAADARDQATQARGKVISIDALSKPPEAAIVAPPPSRPGHGLRVAGLGVAAGGVACLAGGAVFGLKASSASSDVSNAKDAWTTELDARAAEGISAQHTMYVLYGVGGALVISGAVLYYLGSRSGEHDTSGGHAIAVAPVIAPAMAGFSVEGRF